MDLKKVWNDKKISECYIGIRPQYIKLKNNSKESFKRAKEVYQQSEGPGGSEGQKNSGAWGKSKASCN